MRAMAISLPLDRSIWIQYEPNRSQVHLHRIPPPIARRQPPPHDRCESAHLPMQLPGQSAGPAAKAPRGIAGHGDGTTTYATSSCSRPGDTTASFSAARSVRIATIPPPAVLATSAEPRRKRPKPHAADEQIIAGDCFKTSADGQPAWLECRPAPCGTPPALDLRLQAFDRLL